MTATLTPLDAALSYARLGWPVVPLHTPVAGVCDCPKRASCVSPGKHPRTIHGLDDATVDQAKITRWWRIWPHANIGIDLLRAGLLDIAPDSIQWHAEFIARGLPRTASFRSGGGDGHEHHFYRRPEMCPAHRLCRQDEYDILSAGYAVMPPSVHVSGQQYAWLEHPDDVPPVAAPAWGVEEVQSAVRSRHHLNGTDSGEVHVVGPEPPVRLSGADLDVWAGKYPRIKADGKIDRSGSLWDIGCILARAGASQSSIRHALQDRDETLGWSKYSGRSDANTRYAVLAHRVLSGEAPRIRLKQAAEAPPATPSAALEQTWPEPENRGLAVLSEQGNVEYVEDLVKPGRIVVWAAEEGSGKSYTVNGEMAIRLVTAGGSLAGTWPIVGRHSVLVLSEMHSDDDYEREAVVLQSLGLDRSALNGVYWRLPLMTAAHGKPCLQESEWCSWSIEWCKSKGIHVLIVDTATGATDVDPWGHAMQAVYRQLRLMLNAYPELAIVLVVHCKKPQAGASGERRITDVIGEWGRWCDVIVLQEREDMTSVKLTSFKRVRHMRKILVTQRGGLLVEPIPLDGSTKVAPSQVILTVSENQGVTLTELADLLGVSKRTVVKYVDQAEKKGSLYCVVGDRGTRRVFVPVGPTEDL